MTRIRQVILMAAWMAGIVRLAGTSRAEDLDKQRCPKPGKFALVFSFGYGSDTMPQEDARFDELLAKIKDAAFNVVHCTYTEKRLELCKKHGVKINVDLPAPEVHHVYKSPDKERAVCEKLRGNPDVWGYNIWNDRFAKSGEGRRHATYARALGNVRASACTANPCLVIVAGPCSDKNTSSQAERCGHLAGLRWPPVRHAF